MEKRRGGFELASACLTYLNLPDTGLRFYQKVGLRGGALTDCVKLQA